MKYRVLWFIEIVLVALLALVLLVPIQDYAMREFKEYTRNPSPATLKAFQDKSEEESRLRLMIATPLAAVMFTLAIPIFRIRKRSRRPS
jgi:hypothetical protein